ncbi:MAG TPA: hotdog fold thioesterase [Propionibacteriaceae bacterium]
MTDAAAPAFEVPRWFSSMRSALDDKMGLEILEMTAERVVGRMPVEGNTQPMGLWHGGASCVLAETLASVGAAVHAFPDRLAFGVDINATHHQSASSGWVTGTATALRLGRTVVTYEIVIVDDAGTRICTARVTCQVAPARKTPVDLLGGASSATEASDNDSVPPDRHPLP